MDQRMAFVCHVKIQYSVVSCGALTESNALTENWVNICFKGVNGPAIMKFIS